MKFVLAGILAIAPFAAAAPDSLRPQDVIGHLEQAIAWYRDVTAAESSAADVLIRENLHQTALKALQLAFQFARAESALASTGQSPQAPAAASGNLQQAAARAADRVASVQSRISETEAELSKAVGKRRETLLAQRNELTAELNLAKEIQQTVQNLVNFSGAIGSGGGALAAQIAELERSVPEVSSGKSPAPAAATTPAAKENAAASFSPESSGMLGLITELLSNHESRSRLDDVRRKSDELEASINQLRGPLTTEARDSIARSDQIVGQAGSEDPAQLAASQKELTALGDRFKQISTAIVPLGEERIAVGTARSYLHESMATLDQESARAGRYLLVRGVTLALVVFVVLFISELWRRATFRYIRDARRRRQFLLMRRAVVSVAIVLALVFGFVSEFGSLATYAGFVTAGVAVALQSPILSVVAYFFLIGRYGIRVGDRVTISGVTGEVIEIGLVRLYLMELAGTGPDLHSTGRVVVFSNSVIFQPAALYKQMPGIDYVWHTAMVTLTADSDFQLAESTLNGAVESVFKNYRDRIERQYKALEQSVDVHISPPKPESRLRFSDAGLQYTVRYPAEIQRAAEIDNEILRALHDAVEENPKLTVAPSGMPKLQAA